MNETNADSRYEINIIKFSSPGSFLFIEDINSMY